MLPIMHIMDRFYYSILRYRTRNALCFLFCRFKKIAIVYLTSVGGFYLNTQENITICLNVDGLTVHCIYLILVNLSTFICLVIYASTEILNLIQVHKIAWTLYLGVICRLSMRQQQTT